MEELIQKRGKWTLQWDYFCLFIRRKVLCHELSSQPVLWVCRWFEWLSINHLSKLPEIERILRSVSQGLMLIFAFLFQSGLPMNEKKASEDEKLL